MLIRHLMTRNVSTLSVSTKCREALRAFKIEGIRHAPVMSGDELVGVVSERDLLRQLPNTVTQLEEDDGWAAEQARVAVAMTRDPLTCGPNDAIDEVAACMMQKKVSCLPVVEEGRLVGIVTSSDLFRGFATILSGSEGRRVSFMVPRRSESAGKDFDPVALCARMQLRVTSLICSRMDNGAELYLMQVEASDLQFERLVLQSAKQGALHLASSELRRRSA